MHRALSSGPLAVFLLLTACGGSAPTPPASPPGPERNEGEQTGEAARQDRPQQHEQRDQPNQDGAAPTREMQAPGKESAFDSNAWNSAVGLGGGTGGRFRGRFATPEGGVAAPRGGEPEGSESYEGKDPSTWKIVGEAPLSTFGADVDTASFTNVRRMLGENRMPPTEAVRVEEFVNACRYELAEPEARQPFAFDGEVAPCPWQPEHELVRVSLNTQSIAADKLPPCNLVFLVDVSGSMNDAAKLPLLQRALPLLVQQLRPQDRVSIVTYASGVRTPLDSAQGNEQARILESITQLRAGGSTNGQGGIQAAYDLAMQNRVAGVNRVVLATDGDFNIGIQDPDELEEFVADKRSKGVFLTVLGFGAGNLKEDRLERLANRGDGVYHYIDELSTARRVLVESFGATLMTMAKDVKLQAEFNPKQVARYRLLGYENRALRDVEFRDDTKDGGEVGAGHTVTALYEVERLQVAKPTDGPLLTLRVRYKPPQGDTSKEVAHELPAPAPGRATPLSGNGRTAATAAALALFLRADPHAEVTLGLVRELATGVDADRNAELVALVERTGKVKSQVEGAAAAAGDDQGN